MKSAAPHFDTPLTFATDPGFLSTEEVAGENPSREFGESAPSEVSVPPKAPGQLPPFPVPWRHPLRSAAWLVRTGFGLLSLIVLLAVIAAIPIVNFLALGYLLDVERRVGRTGRLRDGFPLLADAPRLGSIAAGVALWLLPLQFLASMAADARLIAPQSNATFALHLALNVAWVLITLHLVLALARGGSPGCFVRPIKNARWLRQRLRAGDYMSHASRHVREFVTRLRLGHHFWLGVRGFGVAFAWLLIPTLFYAAVRRPEGVGILLMLTGGLLLVLSLSWAPFLQARFATENRFLSGFQLREVRQLNRYAPLAWGIATIVLYALSLPLYLFKVFLLPPDAMWPITLIFVASIYPTRVVTGWAYHRAATRRAAGRPPAHWTLRWGASTVLVALLGVYVFILYFTQFIGEGGKAVLFQHHALLLPVPF